jgi:hypothetical protein
MIINNDYKKKKKKLSMINSFYISVECSWYHELIHKFWNIFLYTYFFLNLFLYMYKKILLIF